MPDELVIELTLVGVPLPPECAEAYWEGIRVLAEMVKREAQSLDGGGLRSVADGSTSTSLSVNMDGALLNDEECSTEVLV